MPTKLRPLAFLAAIFLLQAIRRKVADAPMKKKRDFAEKLRPFAKQVEIETGIPADFGIAQAALESGWGASKLTREANNLFGFTGESWEKEGKEVYRIGTREVVFKRYRHSGMLPKVGEIWGGPDFTGARIDAVKVVKTVGSKKPGESYVRAQVDVFIGRPFRKYADWGESYRDWVRLITKWKRYAKVEAAAKAGDFTAFAVAMQGSGYATDPKYGEKLIATHKRLPKEEKEA